MLSEPEDADCWVGKGLVIPRCRPIPRVILSLGVPRKICQWDMGGNVFSCQSFYLFTSLLARTVAFRGPTALPVSTQPVRAEICFSISCMCKIRRGALLLLVDQSAWLVLVPSTTTSQMVPMEAHGTWAIPKELSRAYIIAPLPSVICSRYSVPDLASAVD